MTKNKAALAHRAWNLLRLTLLWARKGGVFRRRSIMDLQLLPNYLKNLRITQSDSTHYREREFSFDETPLFHFKLQKSSSMRLWYLPRIPCLNPSQVDFDVSEDEARYDRNGDDEYNYSRSDDEDDDVSNKEICLRKEEEEIDSKAEEFIAKFYEQMKMQRQVSHLQYNEMLHRGIS